MRGFTLLVSSLFLALLALQKLSEYVFFWEEEVMVPIEHAKDLCGFATAIAVLVLLLADRRKGAA